MACVWSRTGIVPLKRQVGNFGCAVPVTFGPQGCLAGVYQRTLPGLAPILASLGEVAHQQTAHMMCLILIFSLLCNCSRVGQAAPGAKLNHHRRTGCLREEKREKRRKGSRAEACRLMCHAMPCHASPSASALCVQTCQVVATRDWRRAACLVYLRAGSGYKTDWQTDRPGQAPKSGGGEGAWLAPKQIGHRAHALSDQVRPRAVLKLAVYPQLLGDATTASSPRFYTTACPACPACPAGAHEAAGTGGRRKHSSVSITYDQ
jgi:hypothetical protein